MENPVKVSEIQDLTELLLSDKILRYADIRSVESAENIATRLLYAGYRQQLVGVWIRDTDKLQYNVPSYHCSNCGKTARYDNHMRQYILSTFCEHCGAKMI